MISIPFQDFLYSTFTCKTTHNSVTKFAQSDFNSFLGFSLFYRTSRASPGRGISGFQFLFRIFFILHTVVQRFTERVTAFQFLFRIFFILREIEGEVEQVTLEWTKFQFLFRIFFILPMEIAQVLINNSTTYFNSFLGFSLFYTDQSLA